MVVSFAGMQSRGHLARFRRDLLVHKRALARDKWSLLALIGR